MDEILKALADHVGISPETAKSGVGAILAFLKKQLPPGLFGQVETAVPSSTELVDSYEANKAPESSGGLLGAVSGLAGKLLGGGAGESGKLAAMLGQTGMSMSQISAFLPKAIELLKPYLPAEVLQKIQEMAGGLASSPEAGA